MENKPSMLLFLVPSFPLAHGDFPFHVRSLQVSAFSQGQAPVVLTRPQVPPMEKQHPVSS